MLALTLMTTMMMTNEGNDMRKEIIEIIIGYEGDDYDPSGPSKFGITASVYDGDIENLSKWKAVKIYEDLYPPFLNDLSPDIALVIFDTIVQHGMGRGTKIIQKAIADPSEVKVDGIMGPITQKYLSEVDQEFVKKLLYRRYLQFSKNKRNEPIMRGLTNRLFKLGIDSQNIKELKNGTSEQHSGNDPELGRSTPCTCRRRDCDYCSDSDPLG